MDLSEIEKTVTKACRAKDLATIETLLATQAFEINQLLGARKLTALHIAVSEYNSEITQYLIDQGANLNTVNVNGITPLYSSCIGGDIGIVSLLLTHGADIHVTCGNEEKSVLMAAIQSNEFDVAELLINSGADLNQLDKNNYSILFYAATCITPDCIHLLTNNNIIIDTTGTSQSECIFEAIREHQPANALALLDLSIPVLDVPYVLSFANSQSKSDPKNSPEKQEQWETLIKQLKILQKKGKISLNHSSPASSIIGSTANLVSTPISAMGVV